MQEMGKNIISIGFLDPGYLCFCFPKFFLEYHDFGLRYRRFEEKENEIDLLFNVSNDIIFISKTIEHDDVTCIHFIIDNFLLSVPILICWRKKK